MENKSEGSSSSIDLDEEYRAPLLEKRIGDKANIEQKYSEAIEHYTRALEKLKELFDNKSNELAKNFSKAKRLIETVGVPCHSNLAFCYLKMKEWKKCVFECEKVLQIDHANTKAFFRRCTAYIEMNDLNKAKDDYGILEGMMKNTVELMTLKELIAEKMKKGSSVMYNKSDCSFYNCNSAIFDSVYRTMDKIGVVPIVKLAVDIGYTKPKSICAKGTEMIVAGYENVKYVAFDIPKGITSSCLGIIKGVQIKIGNVLSYFIRNKNK